MMGARVRIVKDESRVRPEKSEIGALLCDNSAAKKLGWTPRYSLEEGLKETIDFVKDNISVYKPELYNI